MPFARHEIAHQLQMPRSAADDGGLADERDRLCAKPGWTILAKPDKG